LTPVPGADGLEALNTKLEANCLAELDRKVSGHSETIGAWLEADLTVVCHLPSAVGPLRAGSELGRSRQRRWSTIGDVYGFGELAVKVLSIRLSSSATVRKSPGTRVLRALCLGLRSSEADPSHADP
jgi:hypothetical protein